MASRRNIARVGRIRQKTVQRLEPQIKEALAPRFQFSAGTPHDFTAQGDLVVETTTGALKVSRLTTTQRDALTAAVGMIIYNTTDSKFQGYAGSSWVNLH
jgi:hypothetical protein|tara:strand:- start:329 stop:628 length:300 start_codon:yes stop_codon:yes gene_type:complete